MTFREVTSEFQRVLRANLILSFGATLAVVALSVGLHLLPDQNFSTFSGIPVSIFGQYYFIGSLISDYSKNKGGKERRYGSLFVAVSLGGLGIICGIMLLIVPGIYLMARWSISSPYIIFEGMDGTTALKASWKATAAARIPVFLIFLAYFLVIAVLFVTITTVAAITSSAHNLLTFIVVTLLTSAATVTSWLLAVAIYRCVKPPLADLAEVFG